MNQTVSHKAFQAVQIFPEDAGSNALALYDRAASLVPIGAFECELASERLSWTGGVYDIFGVSRERTAERRATVELYSEESRELLERKRSRAIETRSGFSLDANIVRPDGEERWIRITAAVGGTRGRAETLYGMKQDITQDRARWQALRAQAECDPLTGVSNRARFQRFLEQTPDETRRDPIGALLLFDLDGFKQVNDHWGHAAGDACLVAFGERLRRAFPQAQLVSRIGGDEFAVLLPPSKSRCETTRILDQAIRPILAPVAWEGDVLPLRASVGVAFPSQLVEFDPQALFVAADRALYDAKHGRTAVSATA